MTLSPVVDHVVPALALDPRRDALRDLRTVLPGVVPFGIFLGMTVTLTGSGAAAGLLGAGLVYGGSAQLTTIIAGRRREQRISPAMKPAPAPPINNPGSHLNCGSVGGT